MPVDERVKEMEKAHISVVRTERGQESEGYTNQRHPHASRDSDEELSQIRVSIHENEIESGGEDSVPQYMTLSNPPKNKWRLIACIGWAMALGFSDGTPGALLPHIEDYYHLNYTLVSLIWVSSAAGYIFLASIAFKIQPLLGTQYALPLGCSMSVIMHSIICSGTKYPAIVIAFFFGGVGGAISMAQCNVYFSRFDKGTIYLSYLHGAYGIGATISPFICTSMVAVGIPWYRFYLILVGLAVFNTINIFFSFRGANEDLKPWEADTQDENEAEKQRIPKDIGANTSASKSSSNQEMLMALKNPVTWLISFFCLFYQGAEVSLAGWIVSFFLDYRHGNPKLVGYAASGFWGGLTVGRLFFTKPMHAYFGARRAVILASVLSFVLVGIVWAVPNVIAESIIVSIAGVLIGPNYPLLVVYSAHDGLIPRKIQVVSITVMSAFGVSGGALFPFMVGLVSQRAGTFVVLPAFLVLYFLMFICWICLPKVEQMKDGSKSKKSILSRFW
ncbi:major facilitator superfamily domain-containing protein [Scheffersomyces xylosifermentans]|uniref:major facilitator superfamily domain-containing protein n=1 Tax=Scheffersomyces xylosifermentans TaxID=1304137 RepID=UPI00315D1D25